MEDETSTEDSQEEEIENPLTKKTRNKEEETTPKKTEEEELFILLSSKTKNLSMLFKRLKSIPVAKVAFTKKWREKEKNPIWKIDSILNSLPK